jgi:hypothetical protein
MRPRNAAAAPVLRLKATEIFVRKEILKCRRMRTAISFSRLIKMEIKKNKNPLHGMTLEKILTDLQTKYGWERLGEEIDIKCFTNHPNMRSSLAFLRRTPWARKKVEDFYLYSLREEVRENKRDKNIKEQWPDLEL